MNFCTKCGSKLADMDTFCGECGSRRDTRTAHDAGNGNSVSAPLEASSPHGSATPSRPKKLVLAALLGTSLLCVIGVSWVIWTGYKNVVAFEGVWVKNATLVPNQGFPDEVMVVSPDRTYEIRDFQVGTVSKGTWRGAGFYVTTTSTTISGQGSVSYRFVDSDHVESTYGNGFTRLPGGLAALEALEPKWRELRVNKDSVGSLVFTYLFWGIEHSNRGLEAVLKKFDSEHPGSQHRQRLVDEWNRSFAKVYDDQTKSHPGGW